MREPGPLRPRVRGARTSFALGLIVATALLVISAADAQRGRGGERPRPGDGRSRQAQPPAREALGPGEYGTDTDAVLDAINRGEAKAALAYYEKKAARADEEGDQIVAAR